MFDNKAKFGRSYVLKIEANPDEFGASYYDIVYPLTLEFNITRNNLAAQNTATFVIYNLSPEIRARIYKDVWDRNNLKAVQLFAGYAEKAGDLLPRCFNGTVKRAYSQRNGADFRTMIEAYDGLNSMGVNNVSLSIPPNTQQSAQIAAVSQQISPTAPVTIGDKFTQVGSRVKAMLASPMDALTEVSNGQGYVDSMGIYALDHCETLDGDIRLIDANNGLIGTPKPSEMMLEIDMLFEPRIKPSQWIELKSMTEERHNGVYKVTGIIHKGVISGSVGGECITSLTLCRVPGYTVIFDMNTQKYKAVTQ